MKKKRESKLSECRCYHLGKNNAVILLNHPSSESLVLVLYSILRVHKNTIKQFTNALYTTRSLHSALGAISS